MITDIGEKEKYMIEKEVLKVFILLFQLCKLFYKL